MRQAGRYLPEYNKTRKKAGSFLNLCKTPELACEVTLQPIERYGFDAAILFSDILTIPDAMGFELNFVEGEGPKFLKKINHEDDIYSIPEIDPNRSLNYVTLAVETIRKNLNENIPLIGFSSSPWTLACYLLEGGSSRDDFLKVRKWLYSRPDLVCILLEKITKVVTKYCQMQINAGANTIMLFDSWGGLLSEHNFEKFSLNYLKVIVTKLKNLFPSIPIIVFVKGGGNWLKKISQTGCHGIGVDWMTNIAKAKIEIGNLCAIQGNLDPGVLLGTKEIVDLEVRYLFENFGKRDKGVGHVFNLGHGISQYTSPEIVYSLIESIKKYSQQK